MAVYGRKPRSNTLKQPSSQNNSSIFSSDDEGEPNSDGLNEEGTGKQPTHTQLQLDLLPSAPIDIPLPRIKRSPRKAVAETEFSNDSLTTSPKKYARLISSMQDEPTASSVSNSPFTSPIRKRKITQSLQSDNHGKKLRSDDRGKKQSRVTDELMRIVNEPSDKVSKHTSAREKPGSPVLSKTPTKSNDIWDELLDGHDVAAPTMAFELPEAVESSSDEEPERGEQEEQISESLQDIYQSLTTSAESKAETTEQTPLPEIKPPQSIPTTKRTYGLQRSFLIDREKDTANTDDINSGDEEHRQMIRDANDFDHQQSDMSNVHDLRNLGRMNAAKENTKYLIDGLKLNLSTSLVSSNKLLVVTLVGIIEDLQSDAANWFEQSASIVFNRLIMLSVKLTTSEQRSGLLQLLMGRAMILISRRFPQVSTSSPSKFNRVMIDMMQNNEITDEINKVPNLAQSIKDVVDINTPSAMGQWAIEMACQKSSSYLDWDVLQCMIQLYSFADSQLQIQVVECLNQFLELKPDLFELNETCSVVQQLQVVFDDGIKNRQPRVFQLLVTMSTGASPSSAILSRSFFDACGSMISLVLNGSESQPSDLKCGLFASGYLVNYVEVASLAQINVGLINGLIQAIEKHEASTEEVKHMTGYVMVVADTMQKRYPRCGVEVDDRVLKARLAEFKLVVENTVKMLA